MGKSYAKNSIGHGGNPPANWTASRPHKYCGAVDAASPGKKKRANKTNHCQDCQLVKASREKAVQRDTSDRRREKMGWGCGEE